MIDNLMLRENCLKINVDKDERRKINNYFKIES